MSILYDSLAFTGHWSFYSEQIDTVRLSLLRFKAGKFETTFVKFQIIAPQYTRFKLLIQVKLIILQLFK